MRKKRPSPDSSFVICKLCGKELRILSGLHLMRRHGVSHKDYMKEFGLGPDEMIALETRRLMGKSSRYQPHDKRSLRSAIRDVFRLEGTLNGAFCQKRHYSMYHQALWLYGSWDQALIASGFDPRKVRKHRRWDKEQIIDAIRFRRAKGLPLRGGRFGQENYRLLHAADRYFGGWREALIAAGTTPAEVGLPERWSKARILAEIRRMGKSDRKGGLKNLAKAATRRFGSMKEAVKAAGFDPEGFYGLHFWNKKKIVAAILKRQRAGLPMNAVAVKNDNRHLLQATCKHFGSWKKALKAAGIDSDSVAVHRSWTRARVIDAIREIDRAGSPLNDYSYLRAHHSDLLHAVHRRFGTWKKAGVAAGITPDRLEKERKWSPAKVIEQIRELRKDDPERKIPLDLRGAAVKHFGGVRAAVEAAGLKPEEFFRTRSWTSTALLETIRARRQAGQALDYMTVYREDAGLVSSGVKRFGNWSLALRAAGISASRKRDR